MTAAWGVLSTARTNRFVLEAAEESDHVDLFTLPVPANDRSAS
jgi:hypothetical protein